MIGVAQVINKKDGEDCFTKEDEEVWIGYEYMHNCNVLVYTVTHSNVQILSSFLGIQNIPDILCYWIDKCATI